MIALLRRLLQRRASAPPPGPWEVIEASILGQPEEWEVHERWAINPKRSLAVFIGLGQSSLVVDTNGPTSGGQERPPYRWQCRLWNAIEALKARRVVDRFRTEGVSYTALGIAEWLEQRSALIAPTDAGIAAELAICAVAIKDGKLGPSGMHADEPILKERA